VARARARQARIAVDAKNAVLDDTILRTEIFGYVVEINFQVGEVVPAGYPAVVVRNDTQVITAGVSQSDIKHLKLDMKAVVTVDEAVGIGKITNIAQIPDPQSRTYAVEITLSGKLSEMDFYLGSISRVGFEIGKEQAIWIPIGAMMNDGLDYVYTVVNQRIVRKNLTPGHISGNLVQVEGLAHNSKLVTEGMNSVKEGYLVTVKKRSDEGRGREKLSEQQRFGQK
jgi:HlyD family secretion protein